MLSLDHLKARWEEYRRDLLFGCAIALAVFTLIGIMELTESSAPKAALTVEALPQPQAPTASSESSFVASKNGTRYYPADCPAAKRIREENRVGFASEEEAVAAGYTRAKTCK